MVGCWLRSGISRTTCKSAPCCRQMTMPAHHHSVFYWPDALPRPSNSVKALKACWPQRPSKSRARAHAHTHTHTRTRTHTHTHTQTWYISSACVVTMNCTWLSPQVSTRPSVISSTVWLAPADTCVHTWDNEDELQLAGHATFTGTALHHTPRASHTYNCTKLGQR